MVMADAYKTALEQAKADLAYAVQRRDHWNVEIGRLQQLVNGLAASVEKKDEMVPVTTMEMLGVGITDLVHSVIRSSKVGMSASDVREALTTRGYDLSGYSNELALVHQTLKRMAKD